MMEQSEIRIIYNDDGIEVSASIDGKLKPSRLIKGLIAHISTVSQMLKTDERKIMFFTNLLLTNLKNNPDAMRKESVEIIIPKGLNLKGKEEQ